MYFLGIDGGGTKTRVVLLDEFGTLLGVGVGGASSIRSVSNEVTKKSFQDGLKEALKDHNDIVVTSVFAGLGDIESSEDEAMVASFIKEFECVNEDTIVTVKSDVYNALYGGLGSYQEGVSVILGTGSVAMGVNDKGETSRVGGYSFKEGDPGSGFYLGKLTLSFVAKALDGRKPTSAFTDELFTLLNITTRLSYVEMLDKYYNNRTLTADLAKIVTKYAKEGNKEALELLHMNVLGAVELIDTCTRNLSLMNKHIAIIGGLGNSETYFSMLQDELHKIDSSYHVFSNILDPSLGSYIGALKSVGNPVSKDLIEHLKEIEL